jgi:Flp pilus assembly pilin Flp
MSQAINRFWIEEDGQDLIEYSLLIVFIAIATMWFVGSGKPAVHTIWTGANSSLSQAGAAGS